MVGEVYTIVYDHSGDLMYKALGGRNFKPVSEPLTEGLSSDYIFPISGERFVYVKRTFMSYGW